MSSGKGEEAPLLADPRAQAPDVGINEATKDGEFTVEPYPKKAVGFVMFTAIVQSFAQSAFQAIMTLYFHLFLNYSDPLSVAWTNIFMACYNIFGAVGGVLSDFVWGNYRTEMVSTVLWSLGSIFVLLTTIPAFTHLGGSGGVGFLTFIPVFLGIFLTASGYGMINPIQSVFVADQFKAGQEPAMVRSFAWYYLACNVGNIMGEFGGPVLREYVSYFSVMLAVAIAQVAGSLFFWMGRKTYRMVPPQRKRFMRKLRSRDCGWALLRSLRGLGAIWKVMLPLPVFWALLFQQSSTWIVQGSSMSLKWGSITIPPDIMPSADDILCVAFIPMMEYGFYPLYRRCTGRHMSTILKMALGMVSVSVAFVLTGIVQNHIDGSPPGSVSIAWQLPQYVFVSLGEILVAVSGLEFSFSQAPPDMKNVVTAVWCLAQAFGSAIVAIVANIDVLNKAKAGVFFGYSGGMFFFMMVFVCLTYNYPYVEPEASHIEPAPEDVVDDGIEVVTMDRDGTIRRTGGTATGGPR